MRRPLLGIAFLVLTACDAEDPSIDSDGSSSSSTAAGDGAEQARMQCEAASSAAACEQVDVGPDFGCVWGEVRRYAADSCEFETTGRCLALDAFSPGPPTCTPLAGCENPSEQPGSLLRPVFRTLDDGTVEVVDTCGPYDPIGADPVFTVCSETELSNPDSPCSCACAPEM